MIIDGHTHLNNYHEDRVTSITDSLDLLSKTMKENNVDYSLLLSSFKVNEHRTSKNRL
jgi:hypothetical protein